MPEDKQITVTLGLPLPNLLEYITDVSLNTRQAISDMATYSQKHGIQIFEKIVRGINVADNHNKIANDMRGEWLLICGSDHTFAPDALVKLLAVANEPPYPKIIGGTMPHRNKPYAYVACNYSEDRDRPFPLVPYIDFHPGETFSESIRKVDVIGSGFTLYHRSVFDTIPFPWFCYAPPGPFVPEMEETLRDFDGKETLSDLLERVSHGETFLNDEQKELLRKKAGQLRKTLAKSRRPVPFGPDYYFCAKAAAYGIDSYIHFGVTVMHFDFIAITPWDFITQINHDDKLWWQQVMKAYSPTVQNVQKIRELVKGADRLRKMGTDELMKEWDENKKKAEANAAAPAEGEKGDVLTEGVA